MKQLFNVPNLITLTRLFGVPVLGYFHNQLNPWVSLFLWAALLLTDFLDGYLARKLNQTTYLGSILDPVTDRLNAIYMFSWLFYQGYVPLGLLIVIALRHGSQLLAVPVLILMLKKSFQVKVKFFARFMTFLNSFYFFIPTYLGKALLALGMLTTFTVIEQALYWTLLCGEVFILVTYWYRFIQIAFDRHDTFE